MESSRVKVPLEMESEPGNDEEVGLQSCQLLPMITNSNDRSMELYRKIMLNGDSDERDFKAMVDEFVDLIEKKLADAELKMFDDKYVNSVFSTRVVDGDEHRLRKTRQFE
jgi:hypothetical protein